MNGYKIVSVNEAKVLDQRMQIQRTRIVEYMVGEDGPFTLQIPEAEFTVERVQQQLAAKAEELRRLRSG